MYKNDYTYKSKSNYLIEYYKDQIQIFKNYSKKIVVGQWNTQTGENTTSLLIAYNKRVYFNESLILLQQKGLNKKQAIDFMNTKIYWKWEELKVKIELINRKELPKSVFLELSNCKSHSQFDKIARKWAIDEFEKTTLPRKVMYANLIANIK
jgi:hypothetical protein